MWGAVAAAGNFLTPTGLYPELRCPAFGLSLGGVLARLGPLFPSGRSRAILCAFLTLTPRGALIHGMDHPQARRD
jgi:hypothetical protein